MERLALEFVLVALIFLLFELAEPVRRVVLARRCANVRLDRAHLDRAQQYGYVHKLRLIDIARRLWIDRSFHVGRWTFER